MKFGIKLRKDMKGVLMKNKIEEKKQDDNIVENKDKADLLDDIESEIKMINSQQSKQTIPSKKINETEDIVDTKVISDKQGKNIDMTATSDIFREKINEFKGDYKRFNDWCVDNLNSKGCFDAGFQTAMDLYNIWLQRYYAQGNIIKGMLDGKIVLPLDPRGFTPFEMLVNIIKNNEGKK